MEVERTVCRLRAATLLTTFPLGQLPPLRWSVSDDGGLVGRVAAAPQEAGDLAFAAWVEHLGLEQLESGQGVAQLRTQGQVDGVRITMFTHPRFETSG